MANWHLHKNPCKIMQKSSSGPLSSFHTSLQEWMTGAKETLTLVMAKVLKLDVDMSNADSTVLTIHVVRRPDWASQDVPEWLALSVDLCPLAECTRDVRAFMQTVCTRPGVEGSQDSRTIMLRISDADTGLSIIPVSVFVKPDRQFSDEERAGWMLDLLSLNGDIST